MENVKEKEKYMSFEEALAVVKDLSHSTGFYGRKLEEIQEYNEEQKDFFEKDLADKKVKDSLDLIYYFEC